MSKRNENKPGYKKTKIGWIPEEWECEYLSNAGCQVLDGDRGKEYPKQHEFDVVGHCLFLNAGNVTKKGFIFLECNFIPEKRDHRLRKGKLRRNDIVITTRGTVGNFALYDKKVEFDHIRINSGMAIIRSDNVVSKINYLYILLKSHVIENQIKRIVFGSAQPQLTIGLINKFSIPLPPLPEQKKIAEIISVWDQAIDQAGKLIDAKQRLKKGLMQQLFTGRMRFPEFGSANRRNKTRFYEMPSDWHHPKIKEIAHEVSERNTEQIDYLVLSCSKYDGFVNSLEYFGKKVFSDDTSNYKIIRQGQFGFPSNHIEEGSIGLLKHTDAGIVSPIYTIFETSSKKVFAPYLYALFKNDTYQHVFRVNTNSSVDRRGSLRWKEFSKIRVPLPPLAEQIRIASCLSTYDREIELLKSKREKLKEQKKGMMQKLLTGEVRVKS